MEFDKEWYYDIKECDIHRRKASQSNASDLRGTQNYLRFDYDIAKIIRRVRAIAINIISDRVCRFRFKKTRIRHDRPSDFIARIYDERTPRIDKRVVDKRANKRGNKDIDKIEQGNSHLNEVQRRELRQKARTNSHDKTGKEYQPRRRERTNNNARSHQSPHARKAMKESNSRRIQLFNQESHLRSYSSTQETQNRYQQMSSQA